MGVIALWIAACAMALAALVYLFSAVCFWMVKWPCVRAVRARKQPQPPYYPRGYATPQVWQQRPTDWRSAR